MRFIENLLSRHLDPHANVKPRVRGMFEDQTDRIPDVKEESPNPVETEDSTREFDETGSRQKYGRNFWTPGDFRKGTQAESKKQTDTPPSSLFATNAVSEPHKNNNERPANVEKTVGTKPQSPQHEPVTNQNNLPKQDDSIDKVQIRYSPNVYLATPSDELKSAKGGSKTEDSTYGPPESTHHSGEDDSGAEQNERPVLHVAPPGNIFARRKEVRNTIGLPSIQSPSKPAKQHVVNISIGRVEIRASFPPAEVRTAASEERTGRMTLDQYLDQRKSVSR